MTVINRSALVLALASALGLSGIASASAATWDQRHPRRVEVNHRLANQDRRIDRDFSRREISLPVRRRGCTAKTAWCTPMNASTPISIAAISPAPITGL